MRVRVKEKAPSTAATMQGAKEIEYTPSIAQEGLEGQEMVQDIVELIRWHEVSAGQKWPGKKWLGDPVVCRYPNLAAEILENRYYLWCPAEHANITKELMADVLESGEGLNAGEAFGLCGLFGASAEYLFSKNLSIYEPDDGPRCTLAHLRHTLKILRENDEKAKAEPPRGRQR